MGDILEELKKWDDFDYVHSSLLRAVLFWILLLHFLFFSIVAAIKIFFFLYDVWPPFIAILLLSSGGFIMGIAVYCDQKRNL